MEEELMYVRNGARIYISKGNTISIQARILILSETLDSINCLSNWEKEALGRYG